MNENERRLQIPDRRKNTYDALEVHVDQEIGKIRDQFHHWFVRGLIAFAVIGVAVTVALAGFGYLLKKESDTNRRLCENQNIRHDNGTTVLMVGSNQDQENAPNEAARAEIRRRRDVSLGIIDMVAPKVNCKNPGEVKLIEPVVTAPPTPKPPTPTPTP